MSFRRLLLLYTYAFALLAMAVGVLSPPQPVFYILPLFGWMGCLRILLTLRLRVSQLEHLLLPVVIFLAALSGPLFQEIRTYTSMPVVDYDFAAFHDPMAEGHLRKIGAASFTFRHGVLRTDLAVSQAIPGERTIVVAAPIVPEDWRQEEPVRFWAVCLDFPPDRWLFLPSLHLEHRPARCRKNWEVGGTMTGYTVRPVQIPRYRFGVYRGAAKRGVSSAYDPIFLHLDPDPERTFSSMRIILGLLLLTPALLILLVSRLSPPPAPPGRAQPQIVLKLGRGDAPVQDPPQSCR
ncbi:MAG: hypothetical protein D6812_15025 [Deltaproteobacteria bacterium]|nr:MAG: hypothetical protein D6812_15025 [Deltaproteobacteria bacterium]